MTKFQEWLQQAEVEEMRSALRTLLSQLYEILDEKAQEELFLEIFRGEEGRVPSMVYY
ncbi:hypothetical protein [Thermosulfurimonas marina]|uniref:hypothetical protein n=1 Tax=Thermosulfurimonas marina TaxID=2047767 RepID=UPI00144A7875|nr:hypothetical protein [Thermosulfurimonas marina]